MSSSQYKYELPKKSLIVNFFMRCSKFTKKGRGVVTPHIYGGTDLSKVEWEYNEGHNFFECIGDYVNINILDHKDVLDVGCGWGGKIIYYAENSKLRTISGFDLPGYIPEVSAEFSSKKNATNCFFKTGYAEDMPYDENQFNLIIMEDVLEHVQDPEAVINECYRVLKPGGSVIIKFPSFKGMFAHHLDRALTFPALQYILPMKKWAAGLNYLLLDPTNDLHYGPFDEIVSTKYCRAITRNLNGLDFENFKEIIEKSDFETRVLKLVPFKAQKGERKFMMVFYNLVYGLGIFREFLAAFILFIGEKKNT